MQQLIDLYTFLMKTKGIEKMIYAEHKRIVGMTDINCKYRYIQVWYKR